MSNETDWITDRINVARKANSSVVEAVVSRMEEQLGGKLIEKQLTRAELRSLADLLIKEMEDAPTEVERER